jgi:hypothetical protein
MQRWFRPIMISVFVLCLVGQGAIVRLVLHQVGSASAAPADAPPPRCRASSGISATS